MSREKVRGYVGETREDLGATLDEIEHRLRPDVLATQLGDWVSRSYEKDSTPWLIAAAVAVVGGLAAILWAIWGDD